jgi:hypothetical protein
LDEADASIDRKKQKNTAIVVEIVISTSVIVDDDNWRFLQCDVNKGVCLERQNCDNVFDQAKAEKEDSP